MHKEINFESDIESALITSGRYEKGDPDTYDCEEDQNLLRVLGS